MQELGKVLIVEDSVTVNSYLSEILKVNGFITYCAHSGKEALHFIRNGQIPDLALLDIVLPDISGFNLFSEIANVNPGSQIPIIFLTGITDQEIIRKGLEYGAIDFISKPFNEVDLILKIKNHFRYINLFKKLQEKEKELTKYAQQLKESNSAKDRLFSIIGHDLRNPFGTLIGLSDLLIKRIEKMDMEKIQVLASRINSSAQQSFILLENLLDWSRIQTGALKPIKETINCKDIIHLIVNEIHEMAHLKEIEIRNHAITNVYSFVDLQMIKTVIRNLLSNAIKFTQVSGKIDIYLQSLQNKCYIVIKDNGLGMDKEQIENLFNPDSHLLKRGTTNETGTGLGLILCKEFIEMNAGTIKVASLPNKGTSMTIELPLINEEQVL